MPGLLPITLAVCAVFLCACNGGLTKEKLVGSWRWQTYDGTPTAYGVDFMADGTIKPSVLFPNKVNYSILGNVVTLMQNDVAMRKLRLSGDSLIWIDAEMNGVPALKRVR